MISSTGPDNNFSSYYFMIFQKRYENVRLIFTHFTLEGISNIIFHSYCYASKLLFIIIVQRLITNLLLISLSLLFFNYDSHYWHVFRFLILTTFLLKFYHQTPKLYFTERRSQNLENTSCINY